MLKFLGHPACTTCKKAEKWLKENEIEYTWEDIRENLPKREVLVRLLDDEVLTPRRLFNTSGNIYKEHNLKDRLDDLTTEKKVDMLREDGMLIRRPFITDGKQVTVGFDEGNLEETWGRKDAQ